MQAHAIEAVGPLMRSLAWLGLLHGLWLGLAAPALAALALGARPGLSARARHDVLLVAFLLATIGPFAAAVAHRQMVRSSGRSPARLALVSIPDGPTGEAGSGHAPEARHPGGGPFPPRWPLARTARSIARVARPYAQACWASCLAGTVGVLAVAIGATARLRRQARPAPWPVERGARRLGRSLGLRRCPPVLVHDALDQPCLCGLLRPAVLLPAGWLGSARPAVVAAVLAHELAHARRLDPLVNLAQRLFEALVFFHPGACWLSRSLRRQREHRADALAIHLTGDPLSLAEALEGFAQRRLAPRHRGPFRAALVGESHALLPRIQEILGMKPERPRTGRWPVFALPAAGLLALLVANAGLAWDDPPAKPSPPSAAPRPAVARPSPEKRISFEATVIEVGDDRMGFDADFKVTSGRDHLGLIFLSDLERHLVQTSSAGDTTTRAVQAPKLTAFEGQRATLWVPHAAVRNPGEDDRGTGLVLLGESQGGYVRMTLWIDESTSGERNAGNVREDESIRCVVPDGGTVMLRAESPALGLAEGRSRLILVTPRRIIPEADEQRTQRPKPAPNPATAPPSTRPTRE